MLVVLVWKTFWQKIKSFQVTPYFKFFWHNNVGKKSLHVHIIRVIYIFSSIFFPSLYLNKHHLKTYSWTIKLNDLYFSKFIYYQQVALSRSKPPYGNCSEGESFYQTYGVHYTMSVGFFPFYSFRVFIPFKDVWVSWPMSFTGLYIERDYLYFYWPFFFSRHAFIFAEISMS